MTSVTKQTYQYGSNSNCWLLSFREYHDKSKTGHAYCSGCTAFDREELATTGIAPASSYFSIAVILYQVLRANVLDYYKAHSHVGSHLQDISNQLQWSTKHLKNFKS